MTDLTPDNRWKLFDHEGWQMLITVEEDEESDDRWIVSLALGVDGFDVAVRIGAPNEEVARKIFAATDDPEKVYATLRGYADEILS